ncbi:MAG TPA: hypothetical protein VFU21_24050 [Kofleriaceae bacterium]|nr:hypothetical protein [Kofleriaceae bacterium]
MRCWVAGALALAGCLSSPPGSTDSPEGDGGPPGGLRLLGVFSRDAFTDLATDDLAVAVVQGGRTWIVHLPAVNGGLDETLEDGEADEIPFRPTAMVGADATGDNAIDLLATSAEGDIALLAGSPDGLVATAIDVSHDSGASFEAITTVDAPDLAGEERVFLMGPQGIWMSDPLDATGVIHFDEVVPAMTDVPDPAVFFATHDDVDSWYVGVAQATSVDLWSIDLVTRLRQDDLIAYQTPSVPAFGYWRRLADPLAINLFAVIPASNQVAWVSEQFGAEELSNTLSPAGGAGPIRGLTVSQQPEGFELVTWTEDPDGRVGVQVMSPLVNPETPVGPPVAATLSSSIETGGSFWVLPLDVLATPYTGKEYLVLDEAGRILCITFDAGHGELSSCGEASLADHMAAWTGGG